MVPQLLLLISHSVQEERGAYIGRVFALLSLVQSGRLTEMVSNKPWRLLHHVIYLDLLLNGIPYIVPKLLGNLLLRNARTFERIQL